MQKAADDLFSMPQLGQDIFPRGMAEGVKTKITTTYDASLFDLLQAYGAIQRRQENDHYELPIFRLMALDVALERLAEMLGELPLSCFICSSLLFSSLIINYSRAFPATPRR